MADFLRRTPMLWLLLPQVVIILLSHYKGVPINLYADTSIVLPDSNRTYRVVVSDYPQECRRSWQYTVEVLPERYKTILYIAKDSTLSLPSYQDTLWVNTRWHLPDKTGGFDYRAYLRGQGIAATGYANSRQWRLQRQADTGRFSFERLRHRLIGKLHQADMTDRQAGTLAAMTLGYKHDMDEDLKHSFQRSGAAHVLAVSGLHTGLVYAVLVWIMTLGGIYPPLYEERWRRLAQGVTVMVALAAYAALTGFSPSVCRAALMFGLAETAVILRRQPFSFNTLFAAAFIILCFRPRDLFSVSFQLSFAAVAGILVIEPALRKLLPIATRHLWSRKLLEGMRGLITVSFAAQIATMPISLYYFRQTSNVFLLTNIVVLPVVSILVTGVLVFFAVSDIPYIGDITATATSYMTDILNSFVTYMEHLPYAFTEAVITLPQMAVMYIIIIFFVWLLRRTV